MPIYEYECLSCGKLDEVLQKFSDPPKTSCDHCNGKLQKLISQSSFHLKGTGWYVTDYSKTGQANQTQTAKSDSKPKDESTSSSSTTSTSTPTSSSTSETSSKTTGS
jgi:putative FmdB family regulatory protein